MGSRVIFYCHCFITVILAQHHASTMRYIPDPIALCSRSSIKSIANTHKFLNWILMQWHKYRLVCLYVGWNMPHAHSESATGFINKVEQRIEHIIRNIFCNTIITTQPKKETIKKEKWNNNKKNLNLFSSEIIFLIRSDWERKFRRFFFATAIGTRTLARAHPHIYTNV